MSGGLIAAIIAALIGSPALSALVSALVGQHYQKKDKKLKDLEVIEKAVKSLSHDAYMRHCRYLLKKAKTSGRPEITEDELENHEYLWETYDALGMNCKGEKMHKQILALTVVPDDPEWDIK